MPVERRPFKETRQTGVRGNWKQMSAVHETMLPWQREAGVALSSCQRRPGWQRLGPHVAVVRDDAQPREVLRGNGELWCGLARTGCEQHVQTGGCMHVLGTYASI